MNVRLTDDFIEAFSREHWNARPTWERAYTVPWGETGTMSRVDSYVLWDDEDMTELDRERWRQKTRAAFDVLSKQADGQ